jgi:SAM-dependent methyltransferase
MADDLLERWQDQAVSAQRILILGHCAEVLLTALAEHCPNVTLASLSRKTSSSRPDVQCDEDRLPFADRSFDAVFCVGTLDTVNDLPGAFVLIRRALIPGGYFLGAFLGAGSLEHVRTLIRSIPLDRATIARTHPQIEVRAAGDLLVRAGFTHAVADSDQITARYSSFSRLVADLRANGLTNCLAQRQMLTRGEWAALSNAFSASADQSGRVSESFCPIYLSARAPT